jgi:hypothetical protein
MKHRLRPVIEFIVTSDMPILYPINAPRSPCGALA